MGDLVEGLGRVGLDLGPSPYSFARLVEDPRSAKVYQDYSRDRSYIKAFKSLNGQEPNNKEVIEHLDIRDFSKSYDHLFFLTFRHTWFERINKVLYF